MITPSEARPKHPRRASFFPTRSLRVAAGFVRAAFVVFGLGGFAAVACLRSAEARAGEALLDVGRELRAHVRADRAAGSRDLVVNGLRLKVMALSTVESVTAVLDRLQTYCEARSGLSLHDGKPALLARAFHLRAEAAGEGTLGCLDTGKALPISELTERLARVQASGDLSALARPLWVVAHRVAGRTGVLLVWAEGALELAKAFPDSGDAPGFDPRGVERPEGARRLLSAAEAGAPYSFTLYELRATTLHEAKARYRRALAASGFQVLTGAERSLVAQRADGVLALSFQEGSHGVRVGLAELRE